MEVPPKIRKKNVRQAVLLNFVLPGAGQIYLGRWWLGSVWAVSFLLFFFGFLGVASWGIWNYFQIASSGDLLASGQLEQIQHAFHLPWMLGLMGGSLLILFLSMITLEQSEPS